MKTEDILEKLNSITIFIMTHSDNKTKIEFSEILKDIIDIQEALKLTSVNSCSRCKKLKFMIDNKLGWKDMDNYLELII